MERVVSLGARTPETVVAYFRASRDPEVRRYLPQKARTEQEALADYALTRQPGAASYGRTIRVDGRHAGDVWCYCIQQDEPNAMLSCCVFDKALWGKGVATEAVRQFLTEAADRFGLRTVGAFAYAENVASIRVLEKNGFEIMEAFKEEGVKSIYLQKRL